VIVSLVVSALVTIVYHMLQDAVVPLCGWAMRCHVFDLVSVGSVPCLAVPIEAMNTTTSPMLAPTVSAATMLVCALVVDPAPPILTGVTLIPVA